MNLAILGTDSDILQLAAAARHAQHEIVWLGDVQPDDAAAIGELTGGLTDRSFEWELLLDRQIADAVLVGRGTVSEDLRAEQLKRLAAEAVPLVVVHPVFESVLPYYEVDMIRRETGAVVQHYNPLVSHPVLADLTKWVREGHPTIGPIHQITCDRDIVSTDRSLVLNDLARDVELIAAVAGDIQRVSAVGPASRATSFASLQVQLTSTCDASLRWSVNSIGAHPPCVRLRLLGQNGNATICASPQWQLEIASHSHDATSQLEAYDSAAAAISRLANATAEPSAARRRQLSTWESATRAMEVVDAVDLSLQKGRTIEVYQQQLTERLAFRGTMAALGCGLLLLSFFGVLLVAGLGGAEGMLRQPLARGWPVLLLAVLAFFLLLQALPLLARKSRREASVSPAMPPHEPDREKR